jgi:regulator of CtrA degradation
VGSWRVAPGSGMAAAQGMRAMANEKAPDGERGLRMGGFGTRSVSAEEFDRAVRDFSASELFRRTFEDGMAMVEETAAYLDGPGREASKALPRRVALAYAGESMRLTTRLMQIASWLLLQRAVNQGEITRAQAASDKHKVRLSQQELASNPEIFAHLPEKLRDLAIHSLRLQARVIHLDQLIYGASASPAAPPSASPVEAQLEKLRSAFASGM